MQFILPCCDVRGLPALNNGRELLRIILTPMFHHVRLQFVALSKGFIAPIAYKRFLFRVGTQVYCQRAIVRKAFFALIARIKFPTRVNTLVCFQRAFVRKAFFALTVYIRLPILVSKLVT